jgi:hypothetical protein
MTTLKDQNSKNVPISKSSILTAKATTFVSLLIHPNPIDNFLKANLNKLNLFIIQLQQRDIISFRELQRISGKTMTLIEKKIALVDLLTLKINNDPFVVDGISSMSSNITDIYNQIFESPDDEFEAEQQQQRHQERREQRRQQQVEREQQRQQERQERQERHRRREQEYQERREQEHQERREQRRQREQEQRHQEQREQQERQQHQEQQRELYNIESAWNDLSSLDIDNEIRNDQEQQRNQQQYQIRQERRQQRRQEQERQIEQERQRQQLEQERQQQRRQERQQQRREEQ